MSFDDFVSNFYSVNVCMASVPLGLSSDGERKSTRFKARQPWTESRNRFSYTMVDVDDVKHVSCPSYLLTLSSASDHVFVSVHQKDVRSTGSRPYIDIGVTVMQVDPSSESGRKVIASTGNSCDRQIQTNSLSLPAGQYIIMPTSTGCKLSSVSTHHQHHHYLLSVMLCHAMPCHAMFCHVFSCPVMYFHHFCLLLLLCRRTVIKMRQIPFVTPRSVLRLALCGRHRHVHQHIRHST